VNTGSSARRNSKEPRNSKNLASVKTVKDKEQQSKQLLEVLDKKVSDPVLINKSKLRRATIVNEDYFAGVLEAKEDELRLANTEIGPNQEDEENP